MILNLNKKRWMGIVKKKEDSDVRKEAENYLQTTSSRYLPGRGWWREAVFGV